MRNRYLVVLCGAAMLSAFGCARAGENEKGSGSGAAGKKAPDFSLPDLEGKKVTLSDYRGKIVLLVFSATWCPHCRTEIPHLKKMHEIYASRGLVILNIDVQESRRRVGAFARRYGLPYKVLLDEKGKVTSAYGVRGVPSMFLVGRDGTVTSRKRSEIGGLIEKSFPQGGATAGSSAR